MYLPHEPLSHKIVCVGLSLGAGWAVRLRWSSLPLGSSRHQVGIKSLVWPWGQLSLCRVPVLSSTGSGSSPSCPLTPQALGIELGLLWEDVSTLLYSAL